MKKLLLAAALMVGSTTIATTLPTNQIEASAKTISISEFKQYTPAKNYTYTFKQTYKNQVHRFNRKYDFSMGGYETNTSQMIAGPTSYYFTKKSLVVNEFYEDILFYVEAPIKTGKITKLNFFDQVLKYKIISTNRSFKLNGTSYKNIIVIKDMLSNTYYYMAKNKGIVLTKNTKKKFREELVKVSYY